MGVKVVRVSKGTFVFFAHSDCSGGSGVKVFSYSKNMAHYSWQIDILDWDNRLKLRVMFLLIKLMQKMRMIIKNYFSSLSKAATAGEIVVAYFPLKIGGGDSFQKMIKDVCYHTLGTAIGSIRPLASIK